MSRGPSVEHRCECGATFMAVAATWCPECCQKRRRKPAKYIWTQDRLDYLRREYDPRVPGRPQAIADRFGWPGWVIKRKASELGLVRRYTLEHFWSPAEETVLDKWLGKRSVAWIAKQLPGRTMTAVVMHLKHRNISQAITAGYTARGLGLCMGVDIHKVLRWVREGRLKAEHQGSTHDAWRFTERAVLNFLKGNPAAYRLDMVDQTWFLDLIFGNQGFVERARPAADKSTEQNQRRAA